MGYPRRIVCLTEETVEILYLLGEQDRIVGISGYATRPPQARREKPKVGGYTSARLDRIVALRPDLVLAFSDLQADIVGELVRAGLSVHVSNQRTVAEILDAIRLVGAMVGAADRADRLVALLEQGLDAARARAARRSARPRVFFEEWDDPLISAIAWVSELIGIAGGEDIFADRAGGRLARERIVTPDQVAARAPDIIIGSWCGKRFVPAKVAARPGFAEVPAVRSGHLHEIKSPIILQPGPASLTEGLSALEAIIGTMDGLRS
ncbi:MAG: cobalamin-binding protein [Rhodospirillaceae bacterium]|nr:cobalamin-binding protein [Rhodospirillaceae bacterium]